MVHCETLRAEGAVSVRRTKREHVPTSLFAQPLRVVGNAGIPMIGRSSLIEERMLLAEFVEGFGRPSPKPVGPLDESSLKRVIAAEGQLDSTEPSAREEPRLRASSRHCGQKTLTAPSRGDRLI